MRSDADAAAAAAAATGAGGGGGAPPSGEGTPDAPPAIRGAILAEGSASLDRRLPPAADEEGAGRAWADEGAEAGPGPSVAGGSPALSLPPKSLPPPPPPPPLAAAFPTFAGAFVFVVLPAALAVAEAEEGGGLVPDLAAFALAIGFAVPTVPLCAAPSPPVEEGSDERWGIAIAAPAVSVAVAGRALSLVFSGGDILLLLLLAGDPPPAGSVPETSVSTSTWTAASTATAAGCFAVGLGLGPGFGLPLGLAFDLGLGLPLALGAPVPSPPLARATATAAAAPDPDPDPDPDPGPDPDPDPKPAPPLPLSLLVFSSGEDPPEESGEEGGEAGRGPPPRRRPPPRSPFPRDAPSCTASCAPCAPLLPSPLPSPSPPRPSLSPPPAASAFACLSLCTRKKSFFLSLASPTPRAS